ncbi:MAG TPA: hypothetical protein VGD61_23890 [Pyrinomonadaceae bacterium]
MKKRLPALFLVLVLVGGAFAGAPLHFGESECNMAGMMDMDCCKPALLQKETSKVANARLYWTLICAQNGTTSPPNFIRVTSPSATRTPLHPAIAQPLRQSSFVFHHINRLHGPPNSGPTYLRNLALLI